MFQVDNSVEASEINLTDFYLYEVWPSENQMLYVTFVMTSKVEVDGERLYNAMTNRIRINNEIYTYKVAIDGFRLENIDEKKAEDLMKHASEEACDQPGNFITKVSFEKKYNN